MSSYYNLNRRADFKITSIDGKRCTAVPRNLPSSSTTTRAPAPAPVKESESSSLSNIGVTTTQTTFSATATTIPSSTGSSLSSRSSNLLVTIPTPEAISDTRPTDPQPALPETTITASGTNDEVDSPTPAQSPTVLSGSTSSSTGSNPSETDNATLAPASDGRSNTGAMVGGVLGTLLLLVTIGAILFIWRRRARRKKKGSGSLLSPLGSADREKFYEIDRGSLGPTKRSARWRQEISTRAENVAWDLKTTVTGFGTSLKATVSKDRSEASPVDLGPRKSEKFHPVFNPYRRDEPSALSTPTERPSVRGRVAGWRRRFGEAFASKKQGNETRRPISHESQVSQVSNGGAMLQNTLRLSGERYRDSDQSGSTATQDLGLSLMNSHTSDLLKLENQPRDPFADPYADPFGDPEYGSLTRTRAMDRLNDPFLAGGDINPFSDQFITNPASVVPRPQNYVQRVRRSRGSMSSAPPSNRNSRNSDLISSIDRPASVALTSRAPSLIDLSRSGDRDTMYSSVSADRRGKGRSDPFDLERTELWILPSQQRGVAPGSSGGRTKDWANLVNDDGVSRNSSLRGNASTQGSKRLSSSDLNKILGKQATNGSSSTENMATSNGGFFFGESARELEWRRNADNVSPVSALSVDMKETTA